MREKTRKITVLVESAAKLGFPIAIENIIEQPDDFRDLFDSIPPLGLALDTGHAELVLLSQQNKSFGFIEQWFSRLVHVHVHDNLGGNTVRDDLHLEVGQGTIDYLSIVRELVRRRYQGTFLFEMDALAAKRSRNTIVNLLHTVWED